MDVQAEPLSWAEQLADAVLAGTHIDRAAARRILTAPDAEVTGLLAATARVREWFHGKRVKLCLLRNARSGLCPEDCHYCSQSAISEAAIPRYRLDSVDELLAASQRAVNAGARRFCMVTSGRGPAEGPGDARVRVAKALEALGPGLSDIVFRVCCFLEGLETAEKRLGWSARSGKVVLKIALERLAKHYGISAALERRAG